AAAPPRTNFFSRPPLLFERPGKKFPLFIWDTKQTELTRPARGREAGAGGRKMAVNSVTVIGNLGATPEVRTLPSGQSVANLSLATTERFTDRNGGKQKLYARTRLGLTSYTSGCSAALALRLRRARMRKGRRRFLRLCAETLLQQAKRRGWIVGKAEQFEIFGADHAVPHQRVEVDDLFPVLRAVEKHRNWAIQFLRLLQGQ